MKCLLNVDPHRPKTNFIYKTSERCISLANCNILCHFLLVSSLFPLSWTVASVQKWSSKTLGKSHFAHCSVRTKKKLFKKNQYDNSSKINLQPTNGFHSIRTKWSEKRKKMLRMTIKKNTKNRFRKQRMRNATEEEKKIWEYNFINLKVFSVVSSFIPFIGTLSFFSLGALSHTFTLNIIHLTQHRCRWLKNWASKNADSRPKNTKIPQIMKKSCWKKREKLQRKSLHPLHSVYKCDSVVQQPKSALKLKQIKQSNFPVTVNFE